VRFQHQGRTLERSTGESNRAAAAKVAARIYAETVAGVVRPSHEAPLVDLLAAWLVDYSRTHTPATSKVVEGYGRLFVEFFGATERLTTAGYASFMRDRTEHVTRSTLRKELSALRMFAAWMAAERGVRLPPIPSVPKRGHDGTRSALARRRVARALSPEDVARILAALPVRGPRNGAWVRPFFVLMWETGLRPYSTLARLECPRHYRKGSATLFIAREIDKAHYERTIPLSAAAREALDMVCPDGDGPLFPHLRKAAMRAALEKAARMAGVEGALSVYDFRHSRISQLANAGGSLPGVAFLVGHRHVATTSLYTHATAEAARAALDRV
jgi:integrase